MLLGACACWRTRCVAVASSGFGGGGYNRRNLALGWCGVLDAFIRGSEK